MENHDCIHEREWGEVLPMLQKISKEVYGNGEDGLIKTVPRLEEKINNLVSAQTAHTKVISDLLTFQGNRNDQVLNKIPQANKHTMQCETITHILYKRRI